MKKIWYVQPILASYRQPIVDSLNKVANVTIYADSLNAKEGFENALVGGSASIKTKVIGILRNRLFIQRGLLRNFFKDKPDVILTFANPRFISYWLLMLLARIYSIEFYSHGQGLYSYTHPSSIRKVMYRLMSKFSTKYICYTEISRLSMLNIGCDPRKLDVAENSIVISDPVPSSEKTSVEDGILYIGRIREGCNLELLIDSIRLLQKVHNRVVLHVIGGGELLASYKEKFSNFNWIIWHGAIYEDNRIREISKICRIGCYPGDAGLSVVHMFALSLPPVVHDVIEQHMGPEPSYVINKKNGFLFKKIESSPSLVEVLFYVWSMKSSELEEVSSFAYKSYLNLNSPPLGERFLKILFNKD